VEGRTDEQLRAAVDFGPVPEAFQVPTNTFDPDADSIADTSRPAEARHDIRSIASA
jgi:hypothetical protein